MVPAAVRVAAAVAISAIVPPDACGVGRLAVNGTASSKRHSAEVPT